MKKYSQIRTLLILTVLLTYISSRAQQTSETFVQETKYLLSLPAGYDKDTSQRWPLVIFLHGSGESGSDLEKVKKHGPPKMVAAGHQFPFILVSPQSPAPVGWKDETIYQLLLSIKKNQRVDPDRIYLTGLSMGGAGTWSLAMKHPEEFAAIVPICGEGDTADVWKLRHMPIWCFQGAKDVNVLPIYSENLVKASRRYNPDVQFTLYPNLEHNSWDTTYNNENLYTWLLAQKKYTHKEVPVKASLLQEYTGSYTDGVDSFDFAIENEQLTVIPKRGRKFPLKASSETNFFVHPSAPVEIQFVRHKKKVDSFILYDRKQVIYRKIK